MYCGFLPASSIIEKTLDMRRIYILNRRNGKVLLDFQRKVCWENLKQAIVRTVACPLCEPRIPEREECAKSQ